MIESGSGYEGADGGQAGAGARVIREIMRTPAFLEIVKTNMGGWDPEGARLAVRTLLWEDPEFALSLAGIAPELVNYLVEAVLELGRQMNTFPAPLLDAFVDQLTEAVDIDSARQVPEVYGPLLEKVDIQRRLRPAIGAAVNLVSRTINRAAEKNPYFVRDACAAVDGREAVRAAWAVTKSIALWGFSAAAKLFRRFTGA